MIIVALIKLIRPTARGRCFWIFAAVFSILFFLFFSYFIAHFFALADNTNSGWANSRGL